VLAGMSCSSLSLRQMRSPKANGRKNIRN
jgi:hypothetical protein